MKIRGLRGFLAFLTAISLIVACSGPVEGGRQNDEGGSNETFNALIMLREYFDRDYWTAATEFFAMIQTENGSLVPEGDLAWYFPGSQRERIDGSQLFNVIYTNQAKGKYTDWVMPVLYQPRGTWEFDLNKTKPLKCASTLMLRSKEEFNLAAGDLPIADKFISVVDERMVTNQQVIDGEAVRLFVSRGCEAK